MTGPTIAVVYAPDPDLGPDPHDITAREGRRLGEVVPPDADLFLVWRVWGEQYAGGYRTHVVTAGTWENVTHEQIVGTLDTLGGV